MVVIGLRQPANGVIDLIRLTHAIPQGQKVRLLRIWLREHFTEAQIGVLNSTVAMINLWSRIL